MLVGVVAGAAISSWWSRTPDSPPPTLSYISYSGRDLDPAASPDGKLLAFTSDRDGKNRIWLKQLPAGDEVALTAGSDSRPRFSPDGATILFARAEAGGNALYKVAVVGGEPRKLLDGASEGDWSPDGSRIAFVRDRRVDQTVHFILGTAGVDGRDVREIADVASSVLVGPRWSPDGSTIAATQAGTQNTLTSILLADAGGKGSRTMDPPPPAGDMSTVSWSGAGEALLYAIRDSIVAGPSRGGSSRIVRQEPASGRSKVLMTIPTFTPDLEVAGPGRILVTSVMTRQNLMEVTVAGKAPLPPDRFLTRGNCIDRQPAYSPDGEWILFSSTRNGNLDLWLVSRSTAALRRLTDDAADDWDPGFTPDGKSVLWSSNRSGHFEIWISGIDGTGARQISDDGLDAENPVATPDGKWIVYASSNPAKSGIWRIRPDGTGATRLVSGSFGIPEVSRDGRYLAFRWATPTNSNLYIANLEKEPPDLTDLGTFGAIFGGRSRWMPDGLLAFIGQDAHGSWGIYSQDLALGRTASTRRPLTGFDPEYVPESFGVSPDGTRLIVARSEILRSFMMAEGLPGVAFPQRKTR